VNLRTLTLPPWTAPVLVLLSAVVALFLFFVLWAGLNWSWTQLLDHVVSPRVMGPPCQRLANTPERLTGYTKQSTSRSGRSWPARCHFGERQVVVDEWTWRKEFKTREFGLFLLDGALLLVCLAAAIIGIVKLSMLARRAFTPRP
jgi:hypothetical protein